MELWHADADEQVEAVSKDLRADCVGPAEVGAAIGNREVRQFSPFQLQATLAS